MDGGTMSPAVAITTYLPLLSLASKVYCICCTQEEQMSNYCISKNLSQTTDEHELTVIELICFENWTSPAELTHVRFRSKRDQTRPFTDFTYVIIGASAGILLMVLVITPILVRINVRLSRIEKKMAVRSSLDAIYRRRLFPNSSMVGLCGSLPSQHSKQGTYHVTSRVDSIQRGAYDRARSVLDGNVEHKQRGAYDSTRSVLDGNVEHKQRGAYDSTRSVLDGNVEHKQRGAYDRARSVLSGSMDHRQRGGYDRARAVLDKNKSDSSDSESDFSKMYENTKA